MAAKKTKRVEFHEITKKGVYEGLSHPRDIDTHLYEAQRTRRVTLPSGIVLQTLDKRTRGDAVSATIVMNWASQAETTPLRGTSMVAELMGEGSTTLRRQQLAAHLDGPVGSAGPFQGHDQAGRERDRVGVGDAQAPAGLGQYLLPQGDGLRRPADGRAPRTVAGCRSAIGAPAFSTDRPKSCTS